MDIISSNAHFRKRVLKYSSKYGVSAASMFYRVSRNAIYEWRAKYDGKSWKSLKDKSHRQHSHQNEHTPEEKEIILRRYPRHKDNLIVLWNTLKKSGYKRSYVSWVRVINKWVKPELKARTERKPMPYLGKVFGRDVALKTVKHTYA